MLIYFVYIRLEMLYPENESSVIFSMVDMACSIYGKMESQHNIACSIRGTMVSKDRKVFYNIIQVYS